MEIKWKEIKEKYPKAYKKLLGNPDENDSWFLHDNSLWQVQCSFDYEDMVVEICYCDLEKFFDDNGIIGRVHITLNRNNFNSTLFVPVIKNENDDEFYDNIGYFELPDEAKEKLITMQFKLLENKLKGVK